MSGYLGIPVKAMTHNTPTTVINVTVKPRGGMLFASSEDVFGLNIAAPDEATLCERLKTGVKWLFKQNHNLDVDVLIPSEPASFPHASERMLHQLVVAAAA
jgi:hypothetical protein